mmetsp:Transcript_16887/g.64319  ORF Transcript_16887/g.64319 Transcript_16887/m.64319 type:complete len:305 (-) Transcript_16887:2208-3122(-)
MKLPQSLETLLRRCHLSGDLLHEGLGDFELPLQAAVLAHRYLVAVVTCFALESLGQHLLPQLLVRGYRVAYRLLSREVRGLSNALDSETDLVEVLLQQLVPISNQAPLALHHALPGPALHALLLGYQLLLPAEQRLLLRNEGGQLLQVVPQTLEPKALRRGSLLQGVVAVLALFLVARPILFPLRLQPQESPLQLRDDVVVVVQTLAEGVVHVHDLCLARLQPGLHRSCSALLPAELLSKLCDLLEQLLPLHGRSRRRLSRGTIAPLAKSFVAGALLRHHCSRPRGKSRQPTADSRVTLAGPYG